MVKFSSFVCMSLLFATTACHKDNADRSRLVVTAEQLQGSWLGHQSSIIGEAEGGSAGLALRFENNSVETMTQGDGALNCAKTRNFTIENKSVISIAESAGCKSLAVAVERLTGEVMEVRAGSKTFRMVRASGVELESFVSSSGAAYDQLSDGFKPYLVEARDDADLDVQFNRLKAELVEPAFKIDPKALPQILKDGFGVWTNRTSESERFCELTIIGITSASNPDSLQGLFDQTYARLPRDQDNLWTSRNSLDPKIAEEAGLTPEQTEAQVSKLKAGVLTSQSVRANSVKFYSKTGLTIVYCIRPLEDDLWTVSQIQDELKSIPGNPLSFETKASQ